MQDKTLPIGTVVSYYNLATDETVRLKVAKAEKWCKRCYFHGPERHCPDKWVCGPVARTDKTAIVFLKI